MGKIYWKSLDDSQKSIWVKIINDSVGYTTLVIQNFQK